MDFLSYDTGTQLFFCCVNSVHDNRRLIMKTTQTLLAIVCALVLTACNTIQGAGKDIERGGEKIQDAAQSAKDKM